MTGRVTISIQTGDITRMPVDAIVNAANTALAPGGGVCGAIHRAAGPGLADECARLGGCATGDAKITAGYDLPAKHVIHTVGPVWHGGTAGETDLLASCYRRSLDLARDYHLGSIAFPAISTGIFGYPAREAAGVAVKAVTDWARDAAPGIDLAVTFVCFDDAMAAHYRHALASARH